MSCHHKRSKSLIILSLLLWLVFGVSHTAIAQFDCSKRDSTLYIDYDIRYDVFEHIFLSRKTANYQDSVYSNTLLVEVFENDEFEYSTRTELEKGTFKCYYYWSQDTLIIEGGFGKRSTVGFSAKIIHDEEVIVKSMNQSHDFPVYAVDPFLPPKFRVDVPCMAYDMVIAELPTLLEKAPIFGRVIFCGNNFFEEIDAEKKMRSYNMEIYFKAVYRKPARIR